jgi:hypothetical protein
MSPVSRLNRWAHLPDNRDSSLNNDQDSYRSLMRASSHRLWTSQCGKALNKGLRC